MISWEYILEVKPMDKDTLKTIELAKKGDAQAFEQLFQQYYNYVYFYALKLCSNEFDASDVTQDTFLEVKKSIHTLKNTSYFNAWLARITFSKCTTLFRKKKDVYYDVGTLAAFESKAEQNKDYIPHELADSKNEKEIINHLISTLSDKQQEILNLLYFKQLSYEEVAKTLHIPMGTAKSRSNLAKQEFKKRVEAFERQEGRKLHFNIDQLTTAGASFSILAWIQQKLFSSTKYQIMNISTVAVFTGVTIITGVETYQAVENLKAAERESSREISMPRQANHIQQTLSSSYPSFPEVSFQENEINNAKDAYFALLEFVRNHDDVNRLNEGEKTQVKELYQTFLESENGYKEYFQLQYSEYFESL